MSNRFKISFEENVATEGLSGAGVGAVIGMLFFGVGAIPGAIIGHFWQEALIKREEEEKKLKQEIKEIEDKKKNKEEYDQKLLDIKLYMEKKLEQEIREMKIKAKEEALQNKKVSKEEITEQPPVVVDVAEGEVAEVVPEAEAVLDTQIEEKTEEVELQEEMKEGLEALKFIAGKIGTPSATDVALFRVCANMAVAGTKRDAQKFLPAMEAKKPIDPKEFDDKIKEVQKKIAVLNLELAGLKAKKKIG